MSLHHSRGDENGETGSGFRKSRLDNDIGKPELIGQELGKTDAAQSVRCTDKDP